MNTEIEIRKDQRPILMKSKIVHWVSLDTAERAQEAISKQTGHSFLRIKELGISVNTAEIEGIYTIDQYQELIKLKQGMWQCEYKVWHQRKGECNCKSEYYRRHQESLNKTKEAKENRDPTPEEKIEIRKKIDEISEHLRDVGILKNVANLENRICIKCSNKIPSYSKYYCSGLCIEKAKSDGTYDREEELKEAANSI